MDEHTEVYTLTLTLTGDDAREYADAISRTERHVAVYNLLHPEFDNSGADA